MADHFDEKSGVVPSKTSWGNWAQTIDEVFIEVNVPKGTKGREISCDIKPKSIKFCLKGKEFFKVTQSVSIFPRIWTSNCCDKQLITFLWFSS